MKTIDKIIPIIVLVLIGFIGYLLILNKSDSKVDYRLNYDDIKDYFNMDIKEIKKKHGQEDKVIVYNDKLIECYCFDKEEKCFCVNNQDNVIALVLLPSYKNISFDGIKTNALIKDLSKKYKAIKIKAENKEKCIIKSIENNQNEYKIIYRTKEYCNKEQVNNIDFIEIYK